MNRQTLADVLQSTSQTGSYTLATVLEGVEAGSQLLLRDGDGLWQTQSAGLLQRQLAVLQACTATGFLTLEGQRVFAERFGAVSQLVVCGGGHVAAALVKCQRFDLCPACRRHPPASNLLRRSHRGS